MGDRKGCECIQIPKNTNDVSIVNTGRRGPSSASIGIWISNQSRQFPSWKRSVRLMIEQLPNLRQSNEIRIPLRSRTDCEADDWLDAKSSASWKMRMCGSRIPHTA